MISDQRFLPETTLKGVELWDWGPDALWCAGVFLYSLARFARDVVTF